MAVTFTVAGYNEPYGKDETQKRTYLHGQISITGGTYVTGGFIPNYGSIVDQSGQVVLLDRLNINPDTLWLGSIAGKGLTYQYNKSTGAIQIFNGGTELANNAAITADTVEFEAEWVKA